MDNKFYNMFNEFMSKQNFKSEKDRKEKINEFIMKYNTGMIQYQKTPLDRAYELLEKAYNAKSKDKAMEKAVEAYNMSNDCFDAIIFLADLEEDAKKGLEILEEPLEDEKERLKKEGYFRRENIGDFYLIFETRPYIRGLYSKAEKAAAMGKFRLAANTFEEIIRLNENDNMGARFDLMRIYALLEDEQKMLKVYNKYKSDDIYMLLPLLVLYYKSGNQKETEKYLRKIDENYKEFLRYLKLECEYERFKIDSINIYEDPEIMSMLEILDELDFLFMQIEDFDEEIYEMGAKLGLIEKYSKKRILEEIEKLEAEAEAKEKEEAKAKTKKKTTATKKGTTKKKK